MGIRESQWISISFTPTAAAVPEVVSRLDRIHTTSGTSYAAIKMANAFFSYLLVNKLFDVICQGPQLHLYSPTSGVYQLSGSMS